MHIVFFNRSYFPDTGATGQLLTELSQDLVRDHGATVTVVVGGAGRPGGFRLVHRGQHEGVEILRARGTGLSRRGFVGRFTNYLTYFFSAFVASFRLRSPDVVVALTDPPIIGLVAWVTARRTGARLVFLCQDVFPEVATLLEDFRSETVNAILQSVNRFLLAKADRVIALGDCMKRRLVEGKGAAPDKIVVIHNWADAASIEPAEKDNSFSRAHGLVEPFVVMHSGNMGLSQNLDCLIDAAESLRENTDIRFVMVGEGVRRAALEQRARSRGLTNVVFIDYQPKANLKESFAAADLFIVSLKDGLAGYIVPSKVYGILAAGRPYLAAVEASSEAAAIAREYECGLVIEPGDAGGMADAITRLYTDRSLARRLGENARRASRHFDRTTQIARYQNLFLSELGLAGTSPDACVETSL